MPGKRNANILPKLGERLKKWRKSEGLRLADVSKMIKGTSGPLSEIENNKSYPTVETIAMFHKRSNLKGYKNIALQDPRRGSRTSLVSNLGSKYSPTRIRTWVSWPRTSHT